jgi:hypothetical protein
MTFVTGVNGVAIFGSGAWYHQADRHTHNPRTGGHINHLLWKCEISSSHGGEHEVQICLLGFTAV